MAKARIADSPARKEALDPTNSFIVQAPAGSGKTGLLIKRFLTLLAYVEKPEEILAITFTRKAAGEMRSRIIDSFLLASSEDITDSDHERELQELARKALERDRTMGWGLKDNPSRLKVYTIDALSLSFAHLTPVLSKLGRPPGLTEKAGDYYLAAARRTVMLMESEDKDGVAVRDALSHMGNSVSALEERVVTMLSKRDQWRRHTSGLDGNLKAWDDKAKKGLEETLREIVEDALHTLLPLLGKERIEAIIKFARFVEKNLSEESVERNVASTLASLDGPPGTRAENLVSWKAFSDFLLTKGAKGVLRKSRGVNARIGFPNEKTPEIEAMKNGFQALLEDLASEERIEPLLQEVRRLPAAKIGADDWAILRSLLHILPLAEEELKKVFSESNEVDFTEVALSALTSLGSDEDPTDLMLAIDMKLSHILVDEYQDTSRTQLSLLEKLTCGWESGDGRTLFIVGDPMQSIYLFREAEVGLFLDAIKSGIGTVELTPLTLECNFRSTEKIIDWVNATFVSAFSEKPGKDDSFLGDISYAPSIAAARSEGNSPGVATRLFSERSDDAEISEIVELIKTKAAGETVAVLGRTRSHLIGIAEALNKEGVAFSADDLVALSERPVVGDLLSLLRAIAHPMDRVAWLSVFRAPWCGASLADLFTLAGGDKETPFLTLLKDEDRLNALSEDSRERVVRTRSLLEEALLLRGRVKVRELIEALWIELGGPACLDEEDAMLDVEAFFRSVERIAPHFDMPGPELHGAFIEDLYASHIGAGESRVELMTIHRAKGLEFDHVILPSLGRFSGRHDKEMLIWLEKEASPTLESKGLLIAPMTAKGADKSEDGLYGYIEYLKKEKLNNELIRLFYVAATRAKKGLYLFGHAKADKEKGKEGEIRSDGRSLLSVIEKTFSVDDLIEAGGEKPNPKGREEGPLKRLSLKWSMPDATKASEGAQPPRATDSERPPFDWAGEKSKYIGIVAHSYFDRIVADGIESWNEERLDGESKAMEKALMELGLGRERAVGAGADCVALLKKTLGDEKGRWILSEHAEGRAEYDIKAVINGEVVRSIIDRTFVEDGVRWIIDYKTGTHGGGDLDAFINDEKQRYLPQIERYTEAVKALGEEREIKRALYYPAMNEFVEL